MKYCFLYYKSTLACYHPNELDQNLSWNHYEHIKINWLVNFKLIYNTIHRYMTYKVFYDNMARNMVIFYTKEEFQAYKMFISSSMWSQVSIIVTEHTKLDWNGWYKYTFLLPCTSCLMKKCQKISASFCQNLGHFFIKKRSLTTEVLSVYTGPNVRDTYI